MADSALRLISKTGREALDIENDMVRILGLVDWVRAIASEPNMHAMRRRFNLTAVAPPFIFGDVAVGIRRTRFLPKLIRRGDESDEPPEAGNDGSFGNRHHSRDDLAIADVLSALRLFKEDPDSHRRFRELDRSTAT